MKVGRYLWLIAITMFAISFPEPAQAWGREGHEAIAEIAADMLTPRAGQEVAELLDSRQAKTAMVSVAVWADEIRPSRRETAPWHYVKIPLSVEGFDAKRDCARGNCVVGAIERFRGVLADHNLLPAVRAEALRFLIHFIGDIHQPLHCSDNGDRGGGETKVRVGGRTTKLHAYWDSSVVKYITPDRKTLAKILTSGIDSGIVAHWSKGTPVQWAEESRQAVRTVVYAGIIGIGGTDQPILLDAAYEKRAAAVATERLRLAAIRLAATLNAALR